MLTYGNKVSQQFFAEFNQDQAAILDSVVSETNFKIEREIARGVIYDQDKVGAITYAGSWQDVQDAILKIQFLRLDVDESTMIENFARGNKSDYIVTPKIYVSKPWSHGFGFFISETLNGNPIGSKLYFPEARLVEVANFFESYKTRTLLEPWFEPPHQEAGLDSYAYTVERMTRWLDVARSLSGKRDPEHERIVKHFLRDALDYFFGSVKIPMCFCHGHLTPYDIICLPNGKYTCRSWLFIGYRPQWYELTFYLWNIIMRLRNWNITFERVIYYLEWWRERFGEIPVVQKDPDFNFKFYVNLRERAVAARLTDVLAVERNEGKHHADYLRYIWQFIDSHCQQQISRLSS